MSVLSPPRVVKAIRHTPKIQGNVGLLIISVIRFVDLCPAPSKQEEQIGEVLTNNW